MGISNILMLLGGVALFLFGMGLMGDNLKLVAGQRLELVLYRLSNTAFKGNGPTCERKSTVTPPFAGWYTVTDPSTGNSRTGRRPPRPDCQ